MPGGFAPRFAVEAGFLILLGVGAGYADLRPIVIVALLAGGWVVVSLVELAVWRSEARPVGAYVPPPSPAPVAAEEEPEPDAEPVDEAPAEDEYPLRPGAGRLRRRKSRSTPAFSRHPRRTSAGPKPQNRTVLTRSFPRFLVQAVLLIVVAAIAAAIHLGPLTIVLVIAAAFGIVVGTEWLAMRESKPRQEKPQPAPFLRLPAAEGPDRSRSAPAPIPSPAAARRWNVFELENRARRIAGKDAARDEEHLVPAPLPA